MVRYKFSRKINQEFATTLRKRVNAYFKEHEVSRNANPGMVGKSIFALSIYFALYATAMFSGIDHLGVMFGLWMGMGLSVCFIGVAVMHDALHSSYSRNKNVNRLMSFSAVVIGVDPKLWQLQHNVLHHTYTNIEGADEDIADRYVLRFSPHQQRRWFHRFQHIYAIFFYGLSTVIWVMFKDFVKPYRYHKKGLIKGGKELRNQYILTISRKLGYYVAFLVLPMLILPYAWWMTVLLFLAMHFVTGVALTLIFQTAHVIPSSEFMDPEDEIIEENWAVHQLVTTANFATDNKFLTWMIGGLNYQVEHHLFPNICHVHYPRIAHIVRQTAAEFNLPYYSQKTFLVAIWNHFRMLRQLGQPNPVFSVKGVTVNPL